MQLAGTRVLRPAGPLALVEGHWGGAPPGPEHEGMRDRLPFYGGRPAEEVAAFLRAQGVREVAITPLMDPVLWGGPVTQPRSW